MSCVKTPKFELTLGTIDFSKTPYKKRVNSIEVEQVSDGASSFKILLDDGDDMFASGQISIKEGDSCVIKLGYYEKNLAPVTQVIKGTVTGVKTNRREYSRKMYEVTGFDGIEALTRGRKRRSWDNIKDTDIAGIIADECGLGHDFDDSGIIHPFVVQNNENDYAFLTERARRIGFEVKVEDRKLCFKKSEKKPSGLTLHWGASKTGNECTLQRCNFDTSNMNVAEKVVVRSYNPDTAEAIIASSDNLYKDLKAGQSMTALDAARASSRNGNSNSTAVQISDQPVYSVEEAEKLAESILNQRADNYLTGRGSCEGNPNLCCGKTVQITSVGDEMDGEYYVTSAKHKLAAGQGTGYGYWTEFTISRCGR